MQFSVESVMNFLALFGLVGTGLIARHHWILMRRDVDTVSQQRLLLADIAGLMVSIWLLGWLLLR